MVDPSWLPSAIMQTVGALYAVLIAIYILIVGYIENHNINHEIESEFIGILKSETKLPFNRLYFLSFVVFSTIIFNAFTIYQFTVYEITTEFIKERLEWCFISLLLSISVISGFSIIMINTLIHHNDEKINS